MTEPAKPGRPSTYTPELASALCDKLVEGVSVREACKDEGMPAPSTVFLWLQKHRDFSEQYARALEARTEAMADDILVISDDATNDTIATQDGREIFNSEAYQRSRLRVDTRKWLMSKMAPKKYGDKIEQQHTGPGGGPLMIVTGVPRDGDPEA